MPYLVLFSLLSMVVSAVCCPMPENIFPCVCRDLGNGPQMVCSNLTNAAELISPIKSTGKWKMLSLEIFNSVLLYVPSKLFVNTFFEKIRFANSQIMSLSDGDLAFEGLEDHLEEIRASGAHYITQWDWSQLRNLRKLELMDIVNISMYSIDQEMPPLESLTSLGISKAEIAFVHPTAFSKLENLVRLSLANNEITELSRAMLPDPANKLISIDLSDNLLESLPDDMFTNMPQLTDVYINNNKFISLNEETFRGLFENLETFLLAGNNIRCDCRLRWLVGIRKPREFQGVCSLPEGMEGVSLVNLNDKVLLC